MKVFIKFIYAIILNTYLLGEEVVLNVVFSQSIILVNYFCICLQYHIFVLYL